MRPVKIFVLLLVLSILTSCAKTSVEAPLSAALAEGTGEKQAIAGNTVEAPPSAAPTEGTEERQPIAKNTIEPYEVRHSGEYYENQIPYDSDEYNRILETNVYGQWEITRVLIEPVVTTDKEALDMVVGTKVEYSKAKITNDFTEEKKKLTDKYNNAGIREIELFLKREIPTEINNPKYVIENINFLQFVGGGSYLLHQSGSFEFTDSDNIKSIIIFDQTNEYSYVLGSRIGICDENTLVLAYASGYWELKRLQ